MAPMSAFSKSRPQSQVTHLMRFTVPDRKHSPAVRPGTLQAGPFQMAINGPVGDWRHPGNANLRFDGLSAQDILAELQPSVAASTGAACTSGIPEPSHVLRALGLSAEQADFSIRFSFGRFTTAEEVRDVARIVIETLESVAA